MGTLLGGRANITKRAQEIIDFETKLANVSYLKDTRESLILSVIIFILKSLLISGIILFNCAKMNALSDTI